MDDTKLIEACIAKDSKAWSTLVERYSALVYISADNRLKKYGFKLSREELEDIRQDIFASIWGGDKLKSIANRRDISYWIAIVSGNIAMNRVRTKSAREDLRSLPLNEEFGDREFADILPSPDLRPEDDTREKDKAKNIDKAIRRLPPREKLIIKLNLIHGKKYGEISDMLGIPIGTVSSYIRRARAKLKIALKYLLTFFATILALYASYIVRP